MYPHERSLVQRLKDKPFALLGVNSDADREALKKVIRQEGIIWRNWWDGGGISGPIATRWQITNWPTIYVIDADGVVRYFTAGGTPDIEAIEEVVDSLLRELAAKSDE